MFCDDCQQDYKKEDFLLGATKCYKCTYKEKVGTLKTKGSKKKNLCRICNKEVVFKEGLKKRQRTVFCSSECAERGQKEMNDNHWTRKLREKFTWNR